MLSRQAANPSEPAPRVSHAWQARHERMRPSGPRVGDAGPLSIGAVPGIAGWFPSGKPQAGLLQASLLNRRGDPCCVRANGKAGDVKETGALSRKSRLGKTTAAQGD